MDVMRYRSDKSNALSNDLCSVTNNTNNVKQTANQSCLDAQFTFEIHLKNVLSIVTICMGLLLPNFPDFWQHLYHLVLLLRWNWYFCYGYGTFATQRYYCCKIRKRHHNNIIGSNMDDRAGET